MPTTGSPEVECAAEALTVRFKTEREFEGHVYVKVCARFTIGLAPQVEKRRAMNCQDYDLNRDTGD